MSKEKAKQVVSEQDEFLLSRLMDDDLPADQAQALRERMAREPALGEVFAALTRVDELVARRKADQPCVDYGRFHAELMDAVRAEPARSRPARTRLIRFPGWLRIGVPLAAAAMIALVIWVQPGIIGIHVVDSGSPAAQVARNAPANSNGALAAGQIAVRFNRPELGANMAQPARQITYARSNELDQAIREQDQAKRQRPSRYLVFASSSSRRSSLPQELGELPPL